jgi:hypothetical protein
VRRIVTLTLLGSFLLLVGATLDAGGAPSETDRTTLIAVRLDDDDAWRHLDASGLPVFERLNTRAAQLVFTAADDDAVASLVSNGMDVSVLGPLPEAIGNAYYFATDAYASVPIVWDRFGAVLYRDARQVLLAMNDGNVASLQGAGATVRRLELVDTARSQRDLGALMPTLVNPDPTVQAMIKQISPLSIAKVDGELSGESAVFIKGSPYTILTRYTSSGTPIEMATQYVGQHFADLGLDVEYHQWGGTTYPNVIGEITGASNPENIYLVSAHLDSTSGTPNVSAPGADDNASGSTAAILLAQVLSQYEWDCTLRFGVWTGEEQGLLGSRAYAMRAAAGEENIAGVLNLDMIGYNSDSLPIIDLHARSWLPDSVALAHLYDDVVTAYQLDLTPHILVDYSLGNYSDNKSFWDQGYAAILAIEDDDDFTPFYHSTSDRLDTLDLDYFTEAVRAAVATTAHMSGCLIPAGPPGPHTLLPLLARN